MKDKKQLLKQIMIDLSTNNAEQATKLIQVFMDYIPEISAEEITQVAQELEDENVFANSDEHVNIEREIFRIIDTKIPAKDLSAFSAGHPIHSFIAENKEIINLGQRASELFEDAGSYKSLGTDWLLVAQQYLDLDKHYLRKENQLFPFLEKRGFNHPSSIMWTVHNEIRKLAKDFQEALKKHDKKEAFRLLPKLKREAEDMTVKERKVLLPTAARLLTEQDWKDIRQGEDEIGWTISKPPATWESKAEMGSYLKSAPGRVDAIMALIKEFFSGQDMSVLKDHYQSNLDGKISPGEFALAEQKLEDMGVSDTEFENRVDELLMLFKSSLEKADITDLPAGHPLDTFILENVAIRDLLTDLRGKAKASEASDFDRDSWVKAYGSLSEIDTHYVRKENQLFPFLESKGFDKPSTVMWTMHDHVRAMMKATRILLNDEKVQEFFEAQTKLFAAIEGMIFKEEKILWPTSLELISSEEWAEIRGGEEEVGYCLIDTPLMWGAQKWQHPHQKADGIEEQSTGGSQAVPFTKAASKKSLVGGINLDVGSVTPAQINMIFKHMPFDVTYVDEYDEVRYYNKGEERVFPRSPGIIGREVRYCHPPKSVDTVLKIVSAFKDGTRDVADFWIQFKDKFVFIQYFAVRDDHGNYKGVLEITFDATQVRSLEGEQRLLSWE